LGLCSEELRLPLVSVTDGTRATMRDAMVKAGVLN
jgi:4-hydroxy-tetrahydrodipicolinate synthase